MMARKVALSSALEPTSRHRSSLRRIRPAGSAGCWGLFGARVGRK